MVLFVIIWMRKKPFQLYATYLLSIAHDHDFGIAFYKTSKNHSGKKLLMINTN